MQADIFTDLVVFGLIALAMGYWLYSNLGKNIGHRKPYKETIINLAAEREKRKAESRRKQVKDKKATIDMVKNLQDADTPQMIGKPVISKDGEKAIEKIAAIDPNFSINQFLTGAESAFVMVYRGFRDGQKDTLQSLMSKNVFKIYEKAIEQREKNQERWEFILNKVAKITVNGGKVSGKNIELILTFETEREEVKFSYNGKIIDGEPGVQFTAKDRWTFQKSVDSKDPNWQIIETKAV